MVPDRSPAGEPAEALMGLENLVTPFHLRGLQQPTCDRCREGLTVDRDIFGSIVEHRGWILKTDDREVARIDGAESMARFVRAWMAKEHRAAALALCGKILGLWREKFGR